MFYGLNVAVCALSLCSPQRSFAGSEWWRICDLGVHLFCSLEEHQKNASAVVVCNDQDNSTYCVLAESCKGEFIMMLSLTVQIEVLATYSLISSPHLLLTFTSVSAYLDTPTYTAAISGNTARDLARKLGDSLSLLSSFICARLHFTTWDWHQESACTMSLDSAIPRCYGRPIEARHTACLAQDRLRCRT